MTSNKPQDQEIEDILQKFDDDNYNFWLDNNSGRMSLEQWNKGKAKIRNKATQQIKALLDKRVLAGRIDELTFLKDIAFPDGLADRGGLYALQYVKDRLTLLKQQLEEE